MSTDECLSTIAGSSAGFARVDLMLVDLATPERRADDAWNLDLAKNVSMQLASAHHLIAMVLKLFHLRYRREDATDWGDIVQLCRLHGFDPENDGQLAEFVLQFGGKTLLVQLINELVQSRNQD